MGINTCTSDTQYLIGKVLHGFCNGFFGRDSYDDKIIEAVGDDWVVARDESSKPLFVYLGVGQEQDEVLKLIEEWGNEEEI